MKEWGVEAEKGEGIKEEEKQRQYDEMIELRRQQRKKIQSKGADCTNLKEYQQEDNKDQRFFADNHGNTYYGTAYLDRAVC